MNARQSRHAERLAAHEKLFVALFSNFRQLADLVHQRGGTISFEWPACNRYWNRPDVQAFIHLFDFETFVATGCALGLKVPSGPLQGYFLEKRACCESGVQA